MNVSLRKWQISDKYALAKIITPNILKNLRDGIPWPYTLDDAAFFINSVREGMDKGEVFSFAICVDDELAGAITAYRNTNIHYRTAELGYYIGEGFWGRGITSEAVKQFCDLIFKETDIIRLYAEPFAYNKASCRILEKAGFKKEGILHKNAIKDGNVLDMVMYAMTRGEASFA